MSQLSRDFRSCTQRDGIIATNPRLFAAVWGWLLFLIGIAALTMPLSSHAASLTGNTGARASLNFRIVIPAIIRITAVTQPDHLAIEERHISQGYIDIDAGTSVKLTTNQRNGYQLSASYDAQLLSSVEIQVSDRTLTASTGFGSIRVDCGLANDQLVPISYRLHLARGVRAGEYRWPVALAFSLAAA